MHRSLLSTVLSLSVLLSTFVAAQDTSYTFTTFDVPGASRTLAYDINDADQIVGVYEGSSGQHSFLYVNGMFTTLSDFPGASGRTQAYGINNSGQIVGTYSFQSGGTHGFLYDQGIFTPLDVPFSGASETFPFGINDGGQIVGFYQDASGYHGFIYSAGVFTPLDAPGAAAGTTQVLDINDDGQSVGIYTDNTPQSAGGPRAHGFVYVDGVFTTLDVPFAGAVNTSPTGINNHGQIVGTYYNTLEDRTHIFLYSAGIFTTFDVPGTASGNPLGLNDDGQIVEFYGDPNGGTHGFLATPVPVDKTPHVITVSASPTTLSPPNGRLVTITVSGTITDESGGSGVSGATYQVLDEYGQIQPSGSVTLMDGTYTFTVALQASRRGNDQDGRHYTIVVSARDNAGNLGRALATVTVPRN